MNKMELDSNNEKNFERVKRVAAPEIVLEQVKNLILNQKFLPGDKLPAERTLAEKIGVSRPSLREALKTLEAFGIVEIKHGSGVYVREPNLDFTILPITVMLNQGKDLLNELIEAREVVEVEVAILAARRADANVINEIEAFLNERKSAMVIEKFEGVFDFEFEKLLAKSAGNRVLMSIQEATHTLWAIGLKKVGLKPIPVKIVNKEHWDILNAVKSRNEEEVRKAMMYHLRGPLRKLNSD